MGKSGTPKYIAKIKYLGQVWSLEPHNTCGFSLKGILQIPNSSGYSKYFSLATNFQHLPVLGSENANTLLVFNAAE